MVKRRITKASKRRLTFFGTLSVVAIIYFAFSLLYNIYTIYDLTIKKNKLESNYQELQEKANELKTDIEKLNDPKYLADYARENYLYSKEGEYIFKLDEIEKTNDDITDISFNINKNYAIIALSIVMIIIFIYILSKGKIKKKKKKKIKVL